MNVRRELSSKLPLVLLALALLASPLLAQGNGNGNGDPNPPVPSYAGAQVVDRIPPFLFDGDLRNLPLAPGWWPGDPIQEIPRRHYQDVERRPPVNPPGLDRDPLLRGQEQAPSADSPIFANPQSRIPGQGYSGVNPPDTVGDVGANYYIQAINGSGGATFVVYDKTTGSVVAGPITMDSLGSGYCASGYGDPIVLYDHLASRWVISEFSTSGNRMCVYVSQTSDPISGGWYNYDFTAPNFPDYPKYAVWPDAYYVTSNEYGGPAVYALERSAMLAGGVADMQRFTASSLGGFGFQALTPGDLDGPTPPAGAPGYMIRHRDDEAHNPGSNNPSQDYLEVFEFHVDWNNSANSTFTGPLQIAVAEFDSDLCGLVSFSCVPQPGTSTRLDPLREVVMWRAQYRNFGTYETLVGSLPTDVNGSDLVGVRWFELRKSGGAWALQQEGTYSIDATGRFMSSTAMDGDGNIATAYNVSSSSVSPGLRYAGRFANDPPGTLPQGEFTLVTGSASNASNRYGDYSSLNVDPVDECTFWFTGEYNTSWSWSTWIDSFTFDGCGATGNYRCVVDINAGTSTCDGVKVTLTTNSGIYRVAKIDMAGYLRLDALIDVCSPSEYVMHFTDSPSGNGWAGDSGHTTHDAEAQLYNNDFSFWGPFDYSRSVVEPMVLEYDAIPASGCYQVHWTIQEDVLQFDDDGNPSDTSKITLSSFNSFELAPYDEPDSEDPGGLYADYWYAGLNRTVGSSARSGTGVDRACFVLSDTENPDPAVLAALCAAN